MRFTLAIIALLFVGVAENQGDWRYKTLDGWKSVNVHDIAPFRDRDSGGMRVEITTGYAGSDRVAAILVSYDKYKNHKDLIAYHAEKNIALIAWDRWNSEALNLSLPDADEMLAKHGFRCKSIDVVRLLRVLRLAY